MDGVDKKTVGSKDGGETAQSLLRASALSAGIGVAEVVVDESRDESNHRRGAVFDGGERRIAGVKAAAAPDVVRASGPPPPPSSDDDLRSSISSSKDINKHRDTPLCPPRGATVAKAGGTGGGGREKKERRPVAAPETVPGELPRVGDTKENHRSKAKACASRPEVFPPPAPPESGVAAGGNYRSVPFGGDKGTPVGPEVVRALPPDDPDVEPNRRRTEAADAYRVGGGEAQGAITAAPSGDSAAVCSEGLLVEVGFFEEGGGTEGEADYGVSVGGDDDDGGEVVVGLGVASAPSVPHLLDAVLAEEEDSTTGRARRRVDAGRGRGGGEDADADADASLRRRVLDDAPLIEGEQVRAIVIDGAPPGNNPKSGNDNSTRWGRNRLLAVAGCVLVAAVVAVAVGLAVGTNNDDGASSASSPPESTRPPSMAPPLTMLDRFREVIASAYSDNDATIVFEAASAALFSDASTPQRRALEWLAEEDEVAASLWSDVDFGGNGDDSAYETQRGALLQRYATVTLFFSTGGGDGNWTSPLGFLEPVHECHWYEEADNRYGYLGIGCSEDAVWIEEVRLPSNNLVGTLPEEIIFLPKLKALSLYFNELRGTIPPSIGALTEITTIAMHYNGLTGTIPPAVGPSGLHKLRGLWLYENYLEGPIPTSLGSLSDLTQLDLYRNALTGSIPDEVVNLDRLEDLFLDYNDLTGAIPENIGRLSNLITLGLQGNSISGPIPTSINELANLREIYLRENRLGGSLPFVVVSGASGLSFSLLEMDLADNHLVGTIPEAVFTYNNLHSLYLQNNDLTGTLSPSVANLTYLRQLFLQNNTLVGEGFPSALASLESLEILSIAQNDFQGTVPGSISALTNLRSIGLYGNRFTGSLPDAVGNLSGLEGLNLAGNSFRGTVPRSFAGLTSLVHLDLGLNQISGDLNFLCEVFDSSPDKVFRADCHGDEPEVICDCCNFCCSDNETGMFFGCFAT